MEVAIIAARSINGVIGRGGSIPWSIPSDKKHFKLLTTGDGNNAVIMGRRTWQSIARPLAGRKVIVLTHTAGGTKTREDVGGGIAEHQGNTTGGIVEHQDSAGGGVAETREDATGRSGGETRENAISGSEGGILRAASLEDALGMARQCSLQTAWIAGGQEVYAQALPYAARLCITEVLVEVEGDTYFPQFDKSLYTMEESAIQRGGFCDGKSVGYKYVTYTRHCVII